MFGKFLFKNKNIGHENKIEELYLRHKDRLFHIAMGFLHNSSDAEDAVQEVFVHIARDPQRFISIPDDKKPAYLSVTVRNIALDMIKKEKRDFQESLCNEIPCDDCLPEDIVIGKAEAEELTSYIENLPTGKKDALFLKAVLGYSYEQISHELGISEEAARKRISEARKQIRKFLDGKK
ncbi:MAG: RNA polymerase sigma factor [Ruminococcaceae bacterium]|nr:RNA polymerase sigma factor [Oscillospiraceae bacterium]